MKNVELTEKEKQVLYGLIRHPTSTDKQLSDKLGLKHSTVTSIRQRLKKNEYFRILKIPMLQNMGCEMLVVIYTNFSPLIPLQERIKITGKTIEVFEEIFFSVGEQDKGFSLSLSKDYATIGKINDIRTQTFGGRGLLENEYPNMVIFPFEISKIHRFFNFAPLLRKHFEIDIQTDETHTEIDFVKKEPISFSDKEKKVYCTLIKYPYLSDSDIGIKLGISRHTVSRLRRLFENTNRIKKVNLPNIHKLGFEILAFFHIRFNPRNPPDMEKNETASLISESTIFMATRQFETVMLSIYRNYDDYKIDKTKVMQSLKENSWIAENPTIRTYSLNEMVFIKDFKFAPITRKILNYELLI
jgi:DNA-binding MarR family transcriptional regulator